MSYKRQHNCLIVSDFFEWQSSEQISQWPGPYGPKIDVLDGPITTKLGQLVLARVTWKQRQSTWLEREAVGANVQVQPRNLKAMTWISNLPPVNQGYQRLTGY